MVREGDQVSARLTGGGPYGLRIGATGSGPRRQLIVAKLHKRSQARSAGIRVGDVVLSINGNRCPSMSEETANHIIDHSNDLSIDLLRASDAVPDHSTLTSSFRHSPKPPSSSPTPSPAPPHSGFEPTTTELSTVAQLFRSSEAHHPRHPHQGELITDSGSIGPRWSGQSRTHGEPPSVKVTQHWNEESLDQSEGVGGSGRESERGTGGATTGQTEETDGGGEEEFGWKKWKPTATAGTDSAGDISENRDSSLRQPKASSTVAQSQPQPSFHPSRPFPLLPGKPKPHRWQPPAAINATDDSNEISGVESSTLSQNASSGPFDDLIHEVVIWSSKSTEVEQRDGAEQKALPWQPPKELGRRTFASADEDVTSSLASSQKSSNRWQPYPQRSADLERQEFDSTSKLPTWQPSQPTVTLATEKTPTWQPSQPAVTMATEKTPTWQPTPTQPVDASTSERSQPRQHRWQPAQPPPAPEHGSQYIQMDQSAGQSDTLAEPRRSLQDGSSSPVVTTLFLTRVVTDGSAIIAGSGSDAETTVQSVTTGKRKLYGDSSFYEDSEHKYPTIEEQIKMARKVALLLTSPSNKNARGQRMFLKRKEQASKWVVDPFNVTVPYLFVPPPPATPFHSPPEGVDHSTILDQCDVERMRYYEEKSHHDVIPFDVCSTLAAELREEKGRGGRLFARRREKADQSITPETSTLVSVPTPRPQQRPTFVPEAVAAPVVRAERRDEHDGALQPCASVPVNRLKDMVDLPKPRMTPWDSAVQYGTLEPAFEHLKDYRPYPGGWEPTPAAAGAPRDLGRGGGSGGGATQETFRQSQGQVQGRGRDQGQPLNRPSDFKRDEFVADGRTAQYQSTSSDPPATVTGVAGYDGSSGFIRQASTSRKGYRQVHFEVGSRSFN